MNDDCARRSYLAGACRSFLQEVQIGVLVAAAVQPDVERARFAEIVVLRDDKAVGLR